jgi:hypothetical protein
MKNIHVLPTDKPSRLGYIFDNLILNSKLLSPTLYKNQNIYITNSEKPKQGEWSLYQNKIHKCIEDILGDEFKKIILTDNKDLIKDDVQEIDDEFLQWFVKNSSCDRVEIQCRYNFYAGQDLTHYQIIIPREEPKQYPIGGYAPGFYSCTCVTCKEEFQGHKRATQCEHCAIKMTQKESKNICPKCRTTDFETCHSIKCPMRKEEPKQELPIINGSYGCTIETFKQETIEEFIFKVPFDYNIKPKEVIDMCMKEQENIILTFRLGNFIDMINSLSDDTEKNKILKSVFNNRDGELLLESYKSMKSHYE